MVDHEPCASRGECYHARAGRAGGKVSGPLQGRINGPRTVARLNADPRRSEWSRKGGRRTVELGHLLRAASLGGSRVQELYPEKYVELGRRAGRLAVSSGRLARLNADPRTPVWRARSILASQKWRQEHPGVLHAIGKRYGPLGGQANVKSGHWARLLADPRRKEWNRKGGRRNVDSGQLAKARSKALSDPRINEWRSRGGLTNVKTGHMARMTASVLADPRWPEWHLKGSKASGRLALERGTLLKGALKAIHHRGPNRLENKLYESLSTEVRGWKPIPGTTTEVSVGKGTGIADVLVGKVIGELDGGGHHAFGDRTQSDARHDAARRALGYLIIRDAEPVRLANRIAEVLWPA